MKQFQQILKEIEKLVGQFQKQKPKSPDEQNALYEKLRLEWTYNSNAIEGNSLSLSETAFYLREGLTSEGKLLIDYLEAKNHAEAIKKKAKFIQLNWRQRFIMKSAAFTRLMIATAASLACF